MTHPLVTETILVEMTEALGDRKRLIDNALGGLAEAISAIPGTDPLVVVIQSVERSDEDWPEQYVDVLALVDGIEIASQMYIQKNGYQPIFLARLVGEEGLPAKVGHSWEHSALLRKLGKSLEADIVDMVSFEYGSGGVKLGDGPMRHISSFNCIYDPSKQRLHMNDVVLDFRNDVIEHQAPEGDERSDFRLLVNGTPLEFAMNLDFPDAECSLAVNTVEKLIERLESGASVGLSITIDGVERTIGASDITLIRQPKLSDLLKADRSTLSDPVITMLRQYEHMMEVEDDKEWVAEVTDQDANQVLQADLGGMLVFDREGSEGMLNLMEDHPYDFDGMDMHGRMIRIMEIQPQDMLLAA